MCLKEKRQEQRTRSKRNWQPKVFRGWVPPDSGRNSGAGGCHPRAWNSRTVMIIRPYFKRRESSGFYEKSVVTGLTPAFFEAHDEGSAAQKAVQKALGQGVLVHPVGGASFTDRRKFRNFLRIAQRVWFDAYPFKSLTLVWAGNDLGRCEPTELLAAVEGLVEFASRWDVELRLVDVVGSRYHLR